MNFYVDVYKRNICLHEYIKEILKNSTQKKMVTRY